MCCLPQEVAGKSVGRGRAICLLTTAEMDVRRLRRKNAKALWLAIEQPEREAAKATRVAKLKRQQDRAIRWMKGLMTPIPPWTTTTTTAATLKIHHLPRTPTSAPAIEGAKDRGGSGEGAPPPLNIIIF